MAAPAAPDAPPLRALLVASVAVLLAAADTYVVVLVLPEMMGGVGLGIDQLQRGAPLISAFLLGYVAVLPLVGRLADLRGRVPVLVACLLAFAVGSLLTAGADTLTTAVLGRGLQGLGGGGLVPATLALVADRWPVERRGVPLGAVGAVQELGSVLGPLVGALILAASGWRAVFWANLVAAAVLGALLWAPRRSDPRLVALTAVSTGLTALAVLSPERLTSGVRTGLAFAPLAADRAWTAPVALAAVAGWLALAAVWWVRHGGAAVTAAVDLPSAALLTVALSCLVLAFATSDPQVQVVADDAPLLLAGCAAAAAGFWWRNRRTDRPLVAPGLLAPRAAWGALVVNVLVGTALVAALVDVPIFARLTTASQDQVAAALELVQLLAAVPVGALLGGWLCRRTAPRWIAATGMLLAAVALAAMTRWDATALDGAGSAAVLVLAGFGFGLVIAPVNAALLAVVPDDAHGLATALVVVARMIGMLVGICALTAVGLRVFYLRQAEIGSPLTLCPQTPTDCPPFESATQAAALAELHAVFGGAAGCALLAAVLCAVLLRVDGPGRAAPGELIRTA
ncbi:MFS transporter [Kineosporia sp. A_224]|uniref:MFS transporter n=1 Tax=Kineosporia sp. A_224 TaxID=1962180 RepID=UPI000B4C1FB0|nr:MFS transporter [Kineosporia sp. A_224]